MQRVSRIFITYRSDDPGWSVLLDRELSQVFGSDQVFRASRAMELGDSFPERIREGVAQASVLLAVIGPRWLEPVDGVRRIDDPDDWVRQEIRLALAQGMLVVPVLVDGAPPLASADLPADVRALADRQHARLGHKDAYEDVRRLVERLVRRVPGLEPRRPLAALTDHAVPGDGPDPGPPPPARAGGGFPRAPSGVPVVLGAALMVGSVLLPWFDPRFVDLTWTEWTFGVLLPEHVLALGILVPATLLLMFGVAPAAAVGAAAGAALLGLDVAAWELVVVPGMRFGVYVFVAGAVLVLLGALAWCRRAAAIAPVRPNRGPRTVAGLAVVLLAQLLQIGSTPDHPEYLPLTAVRAGVVLLLVAVVMAPRLITTEVVAAARGAGAVVGLVTVVSVGHFLVRFHADGAEATDIPGRLLLTGVVAAGLWLALPGPGRIRSSPGT
jgi:hypothetical protein